MFDRFVERFIMRSRNPYRNLILYLVLKFGLMYLIRVWIRKNVRDLETRRKNTLYNERNR